MKILVIDDTIEILDVLRHVPNVLVAADLKIAKDLLPQVSRVYTDYQGVEKDGLTVEGLIDHCKIEGKEIFLTTGNMSIRDQLADQVPWVPKFEIYDHIKEKVKK